MVTYYLDPNAAIKLYVPEVGSDWLHNLLAANPEPLLLSSLLLLATALSIHRQLLNAGVPLLVFLSADDRLTAAAATEGLAVDNPNDHR